MKNLGSIKLALSLLLLASIAHAQNIMPVTSDLAQNNYGDRIMICETKKALTAAAYTVSGGVRTPIVGLSTYADNPLANLRTLESQNSYARLRSSTPYSLKVTSDCVGSTRSMATAACAAYNKYDINLKKTIVLYPLNVKVTGRMFYHMGADASYLNLQPFNFETKNPDASYSRFQDKNFEITCDGNGKIVSTSEDKLNCPATQVALAEFPGATVSLPASGPYTGPYTGPNIGNGGYPIQSGMPGTRSIQCSDYSNSSFYYYGTIEYACIGGTWKTSSVSSCAAMPLYQDVGGGGYGDGGDSGGADSGSGDAGSGGY